MEWTGEGLECVYERDRAIEREGGRERVSERARERESWAHIKIVEYSIYTSAELDRSLNENENKKAVEQHTIGQAPCADVITAEVYNNGCGAQLHWKTVYSAGYVWNEG